MFGRNLHTTDIFLRFAATVDEIFVKTSRYFFLLFLRKLLNVRKNNKSENFRWIWILKKKFLKK